MIRGEVAMAWHAADVPGKLKMLENAAKHDCPLSVDFLDESVELLDELAARVGMVGIREVRVDVAGLRYLSDAVVGEKFAGSYRKRTMRVALPARFD